jgi:hypothetical protein
MRVSLSLLAIISANGSGDAVDKVRLSLESSSAGWFRLVKYAGYAVAIGCAMEAPETFITIKRWWLLRFRDIDKEETKEDRKHWAASLAAVGLIIIVLGIVLETFGEGKVSDVDALIRAHESDKITTAEEDAASATRDAGTAKSSAKDAAKASTTAQVASSNAVVLASGARREADSFEKDIVSAKKLAADAEAHLADALERANNAVKESIRLNAVLGGWKLDEAAKKRFAEHVGKFPGTQFDLAINPAEATFMEQLDALLTSPPVGWVRLPPKEANGATAAILIDGNASIIFSSGILLEVDQDQADSLKPALIALGNALHGELDLKTVPLHLVPPGSWGNRIHIIIGKRE